MGAYSNSHKLVCANGDQGCTCGLTCSTCSMNNEHRHEIGYQNNYRAVRLHFDRVLPPLHNLNIGSSCLIYYTSYARPPPFLSHTHTYLLFRARSEWNSATNHNNRQAVSVKTSSLLSRTPGPIGRESKYKQKQAKLRRNCAVTCELCSLYSLDCVRKAWYDLLQNVFWWPWKNTVGWGHGRASCDFIHTLNSHQTTRERTWTT